MPQKNTFENLNTKYQGGEKITVLTAYDYPFACILDEAGVDMILVGDSLANVVLGLESTKDVHIEEMVHHAKAVGRAVKRAFVIGDMPFSSYQIEGSDVVGDARQLLDAGCDAVKVEWFDGCVPVVEKLRAANIAVMGHVGLTPQTADKIGGFKVQGKDADSAKRIYEQASVLERSGCFSVVLECVPAQVAKGISEKLSIFTIGIGAGPDCDGQVLVIHDMLGLFHGKTPKFVKHFADLRKVIHQAAEQYCHEVISGEFPKEEQSFH